MSGAVETSDPGAVQRILEERARALAKPPEAEDSGEVVSLVVLRLGRERYAVDIDHVQEIRPLAGLTAVPTTPVYWSGLVNLRGSLHAVLDLRRYLGLADDVPAASPKVVVVSAAGASVGLLVDDVPEVRQMLVDDIADAFTEGAVVRPEILRGATPDLISILDLEALLSDRTLIVQHDVV